MVRLLPLHTQESSLFFKTEKQKQSSFFLVSNPISYLAFPAELERVKGSSINDVTDEGGVGQ